MSNFFERELGRVFGDGQVIRDPTYSGRACLGTLGKDLRVRAQFITTGYADHYDSLKITVLNRTDGPVDTLVLKLKDLLGKKSVPGNPNLLPQWRGPPHLAGSGQAGVVRISAHRRRL